MRVTKEEYDDIELGELIYILNRNFDLEKVHIVCKMIQLGSTGIYYKINFSRPEGYDIQDYLRWMWGKNLSDLKQNMIDSIDEQSKEVTF